MRATIPNALTAFHPLDIPQGLFDHGSGSFERPIYTRDWGIEAEHQGMFVYHPGTINIKPFIDKGVCVK